MAPREEELLGISVLDPSSTDLWDRTSCGLLTFQPGNLSPILSSCGSRPAERNVAGALSAELTLESPLPLAVLGARTAAKHRTHTSGSRAGSREELESDLRANLSSVAGSSSHHAALLRPQFPPL